MNFLLMMLHLSFPKKLQGKGIFMLLTLLFLCWTSPPVGAQHLIGLRGGYAVSGVHFKFYDNYKNIGTPINFSLLYTYYHSLWGVNPYFGIQTGINYAEQGFVNTFNYEKTRYRVVEVPLISQFHIDFWKMRLLINVGAFAGYRLSATEESPQNMNQPLEEIVKTDYIFDCYDRRTDFGFIGGGGLAFKTLPFEIQVECNYQYSLSMLYHPKKLSNLYYLYTFPHQLIFSVGLFFHLSK